MDRRASCQAIDFDLRRRAPTPSADRSDPSLQGIESSRPRRTIARRDRDPLLIHSTSWRRDREAVILSFVAAAYVPEPFRNLG
jgi:hypothetical protein